MSISYMYLIVAEQHGKQLKFTPNNLEDAQSLFKTLDTDKAILVTKDGVVLERRGNYAPQHNLMLKNIFCFWTGNNEMSKVRRDCLEKLRQQSGCNVVLVNLKNLPKYILPGAPIHPAFRYLSLVHRADYLRAYFMHHHGGGYCDIKQTPDSWVDRFTELLESNKMARGYPEVKGGESTMFYLPQHVKDKVRENVAKLIGIGSFIFKSGSEFTRIWLSAVHHKLSEYQPRLQANPATGFPWEHQHGRLPNGVRSKYPLMYLQIMGDIFHPVCLHFKDHLLRTLPMPICKDYR